MDDLILLQYDNKWYRTAPGIKMGGLIMANFNIIVKISGPDLHILKDRYSGMAGGRGNADLLKVQLFTIGKSWMDFPEFTACTKQYANTALVIKPDGSLVEQDITKLIIERKHED